MNSLVTGRFPVFVRQHRDRTFQIEFENDSTLIIITSLKNLRGCFDQTGKDLTVSLSFHGRMASRCAGTWQWFALWLTLMSAVPPTRQGRQQRLPPPVKRLNMQALQAAICLSPLLLRHWARSILQLASSWMILARRFLACQARLERQAFCSNAFQYWYSVSMLSYYVTVCRPSTPRTDCRTHFTHLVLIFKLPREYIYRGSKKIIIHTFLSRHKVVTSEAVVLHFAVLV